jgi:putative tryptophan/tyrosine transport system substrate-binding protein
MQPPFHMLSIIRLLLLCQVCTSVWADGGVHLVASEEGGAYREAIDAFRATFTASRQIKVWSLASLDGRQIRTLSSENNLIVPIGLKAARAVAEQHGGQAAVLTLMIPHVSAERLVWPASLPRRKVSHVHIDQPASRTLGLVDAVFPQANRVGLVVSGENVEAVKLLQSEAARRHLSLNLEMVARPEDVAGALRAVLPESDVLLLLPDALAIHAGNAQNVLLTTYRYRVPVVGFSHGLSKAGAVAVVYSSPAQIGRQGALMALRWKPESGDLPSSQHADDFSVAFNPYVARSLGVSLPDLGEVRRKLGADDE